MSSYSINIDHYIVPRDTKRLLNMLNIVELGDELLIDIPSNESEAIIDILKGNNFNVTTKGGHDDFKYQIFAKRREKQ